MDGARLGVTAMVALWVAHSPALIEAILATRSCSSLILRSSGW